jgi:hypothetical protein
MNEEDRRELIARQHRALYGNDPSFQYEGNSFGPEGQHFAGQSMAIPGQDDHSAKGPSPKPVQPHARANSTSPPSGAGNNTQQQGFSLPQGQAPQDLKQEQSSSGPVAPIGTRPINPAIANTKRPTPPVGSPMNLGFAQNEGQGAERSQSAASNPNPAVKEEGNGGNANGGNGNGMAWGSSSGVWGKGTFGGGREQASVWG